MVWTAKHPAIKQCVSPGFWKAMGGRGYWLLHEWAPGPVCWAGMGKGENCLVVEPCDKERALSSCQGNEWRVGRPGSSQDLLHSNVCGCVGLQCKEGNQQYCRAFLSVLSCGQSTWVLDWNIPLFFPPNWYWNGNFIDIFSLILSSFCMFFSLHWMCK